MFARANVGDEVHLELRGLYSTSQIQLMNDSDKTLLMSNSTVAIVKRKDPHFVILQLTILESMSVRLSDGDFSKHAHFLSHQNRNERTNSTISTMINKLIHQSPFRTCSEATTSDTLTEAIHQPSADETFSDSKTLSPQLPQPITQMTSKRKRNKHSEETHRGIEAKLAKCVHGAMFYLSLQGLSIYHQMPRVLHEYRNHKFRFIINKWENGRLHTIKLNSRDLYDSIVKRVMDSTAYRIAHSG